MPPLSVADGQGDRRTLHAAVIGVSTTETCGVRDHGTLLAQALPAEGVSCSVHWLDRSALGLGAARAEFRSFTAEVAADLRRHPPEAILFHYSVFSYSYRGLPVFTPSLLAALPRGGAPLVSILHEGAYNWGGRGLREAAWALTQRAALMQLVRASSALMVTTENRRRWVSSRRWLPGRPTIVAPVFSNLPAPEPGRGSPRQGTVGLFGYSHEGSEPALVLDALGLLREQGVPARLVLLGAPGADSVAGRRWEDAARARGLSPALSFTGTVSPAELSGALSACEVLLFADRPGPSSRKTTLAAELASGSPVVALDGPRSWPELVQARAALMVAPRADELARGLSSLLGDGDARSALADRGRRFYRDNMSVEHSARSVAGLLDQLIDPAAG